MSPTPETCPRCERVTDEHTVAELRTCLGDLYEHDLPFEEIPETTQDLQVVTAGSLTVKAGVHGSPLGTHPVLVFDFGSPEGPLPPIALILDDSHMRSLRTVVGSAIDAALKAARKHRGRG